MALWVGLPNGLLEFPWFRLPYFVSGLRLSCRYLGLIVDILLGLALGFLFGLIFVLLLGLGVRLLFIAYSRKFDLSIVYRLQDAQGNVQTTKIFRKEIDKRQMRQARSRNLDLLESSDNGCCLTVFSDLAAVPCPLFSSFF